MKRFLLSVSLVALLAGCGGSGRPDFVVPPPAPTPPPGPLTLTVLHHNDANSSLLNGGPGLEQFGGAARFATAVQAERSRHQRTLLVSAGNHTLAGATYDASLRTGVPFYDAVAMELIGFEASGVGNQEFDFGPEVFADLLRSFTRRTPFLSANLDFSGEPELVAQEAAGRLAASTVIVKDDVRVGLVGVTPPRIAFASSPRGVQVLPDMAGAVQDEIDRLRASGAQTVLLLSKLDSLDENRDLVAQLEGLDGVVAAAPWQLLANPDTLLIPGDEAALAGPYPLMIDDRNGRSVPLVNTPGEYRYLGSLTLELDPQGRYRRVLQGDLIRVAGGDLEDAVTPAPRVVSEVDLPVRAFLDAQENEVLAESEVALDATEASLYRGETNVGNLMADALLARGRALAGQFGTSEPSIALFNSGGLPANQLLEAGPFTALELSQLASFPSFLSVVEAVSAEQLKALLENGFSRVEFTDPRFPQLAGLTVEWDPAAPARSVGPDGTVLEPGQRVRTVLGPNGESMVENGAVVNGAPSLTIATLDFLAQGGDQYPTGGLDFTNLGETYRDSLERYVVSDLAGVIRAADYPEGGKGRIFEL